MVGNRKSKQEKLNELKKILVANLDDFLLDEQEVNATGINRQTAMAELNKLIQQDLASSDTAILQVQTSKVQQDKIIKKISQRVKKKSVISKIPVNQVRLSENVLDLRQKQIEPKVVKESRTKEHWLDFKNNLDNKFTFSKVKKIKLYYHHPKREWQSFRFYLPQINWQVLKIHRGGVMWKSLTFALVLFVLILPIRGFVLFGKIQTDKDKIWQLGKGGLINLQAGALSAAESSHDQATDDFQEALANFEAIQQVLDEYQSWLLKTGESLPVVGNPLSLGTNLLETANNISQAAIILNTKLQNKDSLTEHIVFIQQQINATLPYLSQAAEDIEGIKFDKLPDNLQEYFASLVKYLPKIVDSLENLDEIFAVLSEVLGHDGEKRYLVLFQNNNELRATGGFIGSFALLDIYQGKIKNLEIPEGGMYDLEAGQKVKIKSPEALSLINPYFNIWDANWWSDFPTSAKKISWFFQNFGGATVDGVIAVNANVLQDLLEVTGPIYMADYEITITAENIFQVLQEEVELNYDKEANNPKAIIADLAPQLLKILLNDTAQQKEVVTVLANELSTKDIQIYLHNENIQEKIYQFGWSGALLSSQKDYLHVVVTNIGGGKTDNDIYQNIDHQAEIMPNGEIINTVRVTRINQGTEDNVLAGIDGGNVSYLRFYVPQGSEFIEAVGFDKLPAGYFHNVTPDTQIDKDIASEEEKMIDASTQTEIYASLGKTVFANWVALAPGESQTVLIKYKLPFKIQITNRTVNNWWQKFLTGNVNLDNYSLLVQGQSGNHNTIFNSSILLPDSLKVVWNKASENNMSVNEKVVTYNTKQLLGDHYFGFIVTHK